MEQRGDLRGRHDVRHDRLDVDADEAAAVGRVAALQHELLVARLEEAVELLGVAESDQQVLGGERLPAVVAVRVRDVDLVEQLVLGLRDAVPAVTKRKRI